MKLIDAKKELYPVSAPLRAYLRRYGRLAALPVEYADLLRYSHAVALYDKSGDDTLWTTVGYEPAVRQEIHDGLLATYAILLADGDRSSMDHLVVDRIDLCMYGNSKPFRVRIINTLNENFDYFYVKHADASRVYGLELEHILSPSRIGFLVAESTLIEEQVYGIPGDQFIKTYLTRDQNEVRLAKEFVKFNERCFLRLLGDMHAANYVVDITVDIEENMYRLRAIDFDQQCYEPKKRVYQPQYFIENNPIIAVATKHLTWESVRQYQREERALLHRRMQASATRLEHLLGVMGLDRLAPDEHVRQLGGELAEHHRQGSFERCQTMGQLVQASLATLSTTA